jgi:hypothetical protein
MTISLANFKKEDFTFKSVGDDDGGVRQDYLYEFTVKGSRGWIRVATMSYAGNPSRDHGAAIISDGNGSITISNVMSPLVVLKTADVAEVLDAMIARYNASEFAYDVAKDLQKL